MKSTSRKLLGSVDRALGEVESRLKSGELEGSGRYYSDEELMASSAKGGLKKREPQKREPKAEEPAA